MPVKYWYWRGKTDEWKVARIDFFFEKNCTLKPTIRTIKDFSFSFLQVHLRFEATMKKCNANLRPAAAAIDDGYLKKFPIRAA